jgi:hypothetical protein
MNNIIEERSRVSDYDDNHVASSFRRPDDEDEVEKPKVLYILLWLSLLFLKNCFTSWPLHLDSTIVS